MRTVTLFESEIDAISSPSGSLHVAFFGVCVGAFIAFAIVLATVDIADPKTCAAYVALTVLLGILTLCFGLTSGAALVASQRRRRDITSGLPLSDVVKQLQAIEADWKTSGDPLRRLSELRSGEYPSDCDAGAEPTDE